LAVDFGEGIQRSLAAKWNILRFNNSECDREQRILDSNFIDERDKKRIEEARRVGGHISPL
jgi:hypothetical protein